MVIDEIIADRKEFDVYLTLPDLFTPKTDNDSNQTGGSEVAGNEFRQSGLSWVTALARVEFGAMIAGFTDHPNPFKDVTPQSHDYRSAMQLLLEGVTGHHAELSTNSQFTGKGKAKGKVKHKDAIIHNSLTLSRRARIARAMLAPLLAIGESEYTPAQAYQLGGYQSELEEGQKLVNTSIKNFLTTRQGTETNTTISDFARACGLQLRAEQRELAEGKARVTHFPEK